MSMNCAQPHTHPISGGATGKASGTSGDSSWSRNDGDGPIPIPNIRYRRYQGLEEKYRYWREMSIVSIRVSLRCFTFLVSGLSMNNKEK